MKPLPTSKPGRYRETLGVDPEASEEYFVRC